MNKLFITGILAISFGALQAQTNTFPATGNVGIGTLNPTSPLHVIGTIAAYNVIAANSNAVNINAGNTATPASANVNRLRFGGSDANAIYFTIQGPSNMDYFTINNGKIGIRTTTPLALLDIDAANNTFSSVLGRLPEGDGAGDGTYLGVRTYNTQPTNVNCFSLEHKFGGYLNNAINFYRGGAYTGGFITFATNDGSEKMRLNTSGNLLIGKNAQTNTTYKLDVNGNVRADKVVVNTTGADFVFDSAYQLLPLNYLEKYIQQHHHLPGIAPAKAMQEEGMDVGLQQTKLLQKTEELTLYIIEQDKKIEALQQMVQQMAKQLSAIKK